VGTGAVIIDSFVGPYTSVGNDCQITSSSLQNSVILNSVKITGVARLEDSIIGQNTVVQSGTDSNRATRLAVGDDAEVDI
jgi:glucose-1-phosphate thymidylyltransferase